MTNYNDGKWHGWNGGECPVHPKSVDDVVFDDGLAHISRTEKCAKGFCWGPVSTIVAFRVIKEHREPKEYTIDPRKNIIWYSSEDDLVHVKELDK